MTIFMENPLSNDHTDEYLLESADPRWNQPATLHSVKTSATRLDSRIDWVFFTLDNKIDRKFAELDNKIDRKFTELDNKIDQILHTLDNTIDRVFYTLDNKIEVRFRNVERNVRINYFISGIIALCSLIGAFGVFVK
ncbi:MAG: hypothetical protein O2940_02345 [Actinomycetota bacterium]|nr:hypothetical protein [Actinomycetota bacterium]